MKIASKLILSAVISMLIGIAVATPLLASELQIKPYTNHVQGPTAPFDLDLVYANFTVTNPDIPITSTAGPTIDYQAVINVTNPSSYAALLFSTDFWAGKEVKNITGQAPFGMKGNWSVGEGGEAKGAWVDGVWYNVTWVNGTYPFFDENGTMTQSPWNMPSQVGYWMEGVQFYERTVHNDAGTNSYIYLNMNGTWVDVTGRVTIDIPKDGPSYTITGPIACQQLVYLSGTTVGTGSVVSASDVNYTTVDGANIFVSTSNNWGYNSQKNINAFDNRFAPGESRLLVISGSWDVRSNWVNTNGNGYINPVEVIKSGSIQTKISAQSNVDMNPELGNNTFMDLWSDATVIQQIQLTHIGNSYIYNTVLQDNQTFQIDQNGAEATIVPGS